VLQTSELPQPSPMVPQYWPPEAGVQVSGVQTPGAPLHRLSSQVHPLLLQMLPQSSELPQPSPMVPQYWSPLAVVQVNGVQTGGSPLHRLPSQVHPVLLQVAPQSSELPQPSPMIPQYWSPLAVVQSSGTQPAVGPALHRWSWHSQPALVQVAAQSTELPQPSPMVSAVLVSRRRGAGPRQAAGGGTGLAQTVDAHPARLGAGGAAIERTATAVPNGPTIIVPARCHTGQRLAGQVAFANIVAAHPAGLGTGRATVECATTLIPDGAAIVVPVGRITPRRRAHIRPPLQMWSSPQVHPARQSFPHSRVPPQPFPTVPQ